MSGKGARWNSTATGRINAGAPLRERVIRWLVGRESGMRLAGKVAGGEPGKVAVPIGGEGKPARP
jgi:hypothetical protein